MTRYMLNYRNGLILLVAIVLATVLMLFTPARGQSVQAMVKNQPFPFVAGVAMDTVIYKSVKAKLVAADSLRYQAHNRIVSLQKEIEATRKAKDDQFRLGAYDAKRADSLTIRLSVLQQDLTEIVNVLTVNEKAIDQIIRALPRKIRNQLSTDEPEQIALATAQYVTLLQKRKWKWAAWSAGGGFLLGIISTVL